MADILGSHNLWKLKKLLYGFIDAGKHFWLNVKEILEDKTFEMLQGDVELRSNVSIQISIEDYAESLTKIGMDRNRKKTEELSREEMFAVTKIMGKLAWLARNNLADLDYGSVKLSEANKWYVQQTFFMQRGGLRRVSHIRMR